MAVAHEEAAALSLGLGNAALKKGKAQGEAKWGGGGTNGSRGIE